MAWEVAAARRGCYLGEWVLAAALEREPLERSPPRLSARVGACLHLCGERPDSHVACELRVEVGGVDVVDAQRRWPPSLRDRSVQCAAARDTARVKNAVPDGAHGVVAWQLAELERHLVPHGRAEGGRVCTG